MDLGVIGHQRVREPLRPHIVETSRGCTYDCSFCSIIEMRGRNFHAWPVERVVADILDAKRRGARAIFLVDDNILGVIGRGRAARYLGVLSVLVPMCIYMYYVYIESWCLRYAWEYLTGGMALAGDTPAQVAHAGALFTSFVGSDVDGQRGLSPSRAAKILSIVRTGSALVTAIT